MNQNIAFGIIVVLASVAATVLASTSDTAAAPQNDYWLCNQKAGAITNQYGICIRNAVRLNSFERAAKLLLRREFLALLP